MSARVQEVAGRLFEERTTLTVAHRLEAVIASDTVVVMEQGKVAETGPPDSLLNNPRSWFSKLVDMSGPAEAAALRATAKKHFDDAASQYHAYPEDQVRAARRVLAGRCWHDRGLVWGTANVILGTSEVA